jgi:outer membrane protein
MLHVAVLMAQTKPRLRLSLQEAVRIAVSPQGNPAISVAEQSLRTAEARLHESEASRFPEVEASITGQNQILNLAALGFGAVRLPVDGFSFPRSVGPFNTIGARVHIKQDLIAVASTRRVLASRAGMETARLGMEEVRDEIALQVAKLYLLAQRAEGVVALAEATVAASESSLQEVSGRKAEGKALGVDVSHAHVRLAAHKQRLLQARLEQSRASLELLSALNCDLDTTLDLPALLPIAPENPSQTADAVTTALKTRGDILTQRQRLEEARRKDVWIRSERLPSLAGYADVGSLGTSIQDSVGTYTVGVSLRIPIFDGRRSKSRQEESLALMRREELRTAQLEKQIDLEIRQALLKLEVTRGQVEISQQEIEVAKEELAHRRRRYDQGLEAHLQLAQSELSMAQAVAQRLDALYNWNEAHIELMHAMGTLRTLAR